MLSKRNSELYQGNQIDKFFTNFMQKQMILKSYLVRLAQIRSSLGQIRFSECKRIQNNYELGQIGKTKLFGQICIRSKTNSKKPIRPRLLFCKASGSKFTKVLKANL